MSYSNKVKELLMEKSEKKNKRKCCKAVSLYGRFINSKDAKTAEFACNNCKKSFFRELFLSSGSISDPKDAYHLEFAISDEKIALDIKNIAETENIFLKYVKRRNKHVLYLKSSEQIEDFLYYIDIPQISFELMETKILKDFRNNANRLNNFDNANLGKISNASAEQIKAIDFIIKKGKFNSLPDELKQTANLRIENIEMSISEIGEISNPPVSKSGIKHRMQRIINIAKELEERR